MTKPVIDASKLLGFRLIDQAGVATLADKVGAKIGDKVGAKQIGYPALSGVKLGLKEGAKAASTPERA